MKLSISSVSANNRLYTTQPSLLVTSNTDLDPGATSTQSRNRKVVVQLKMFGDAVPADAAHLPASSRRRRRRRSQHF